MKGTEACMLPILLPPSRKQEKSVAAVQSRTEPFVPPEHISVGTTALVGPLLSDRQYQFIGFLVSVSEASMPVSALFHLNHMLYAVAGALCI
jgi:hypothetical protein